jgi:HD-like signal output (HDOD) protein
MLTRPFRELAGWTAHFRDADIPVYRETVDAVAALHEREDDIAPADIAAVVQGDPLMTLKVLAFASQRRSSRVVTDSETVTSSLVLMGISPFFRQFERLSAVEDLLGDDPPALVGLAEVVSRSFRAARFALGFAVHRGDPDAEVIQEAALLHDFAEMLLWCHAPALAREIVRRQADDPSLRSAVVQRAVLNVELHQLQHALMLAWRLPELLVRVTDHQLAGQPRLRNVVLAVNLARHTQRGWENPALPDDFRAIGELLNVSPEHAQRLAVEIEE